MSYFTQITIPPLTTVTDPVTVDLTIAPLILRRVEIVFPTGCASLVGIWFEYRSSRLFPYNDDGYFLGNGSPIVFTPDKRLDQPPYTLKLLGYNEDDTFTHKPLIHMDVEFLTNNELSTSSHLTTFIQNLFSLGGGINQNA